MKRLRILPALVAALLLNTVTMFAQNTVSQLYSAITSPETYIPLTTFTTIVPALGTADDGNAQVNMPFTMRFANEDILSSNIVVETNGAIQLRRIGNNGLWYALNFGNYNNNPGTNGFYADQMNFANTIFGFAGNLDMAAPAQWIWGTRTAADGNQQFVVEWRNALVVGTSTRVTFQIIFTQNTNAIDVVFGSVTGAASAITGIHYTGIHESTLNGFGVFNDKPHVNLPGQFIGSRFVNGIWEHTSTSPANPYGTTGAFPTSGVRYCYKPVIAATVNTNPIFNAAVNPTDAVAFGSANITRDFVVSNPSGATNSPVKAVAEVVTGEYSAAYSVAPAPGSNPNNIAPGGSATFRVTFNPGVVLGDAPAQLRVTLSSIDGASCPVTLPATLVPMNARSKALTVVADTINFGIVAPGDPVTISRKVFRNDASVPITYNFVSVTGGEGTFSIVPPATGVVQPGDSITLTARFSPVRAIRYNGNANLFFNAPRVGGGTVNAATTFPMKGEGIQPRIKIFNPNNPADNQHFVGGSMMAIRKESEVGENFHTVNLKITNTGSDFVMLSNFRFLRLLAGEPLIDNPLPRPCPQAQQDFTNEFRVSYFNKVQNAYVQVPLGDLTNPIRIQVRDTVAVRIEYRPSRPGTLLSYRMFVNAYADGYDLIDDYNNFVVTPDECGVPRQELLSYNFINMSARGSRALNIRNVSYGEVGLGASSVRAVAVRNSGDAPLYIDPSRTRFESGDLSDFAIEENGFEGFTTVGNRLSLAAGQTGRVQVRFTPSRLGTRFSTFVLQTNDFLSDENGSVDGSRRIVVSGVGIEGAAISVASEDGGDVFAGATAVVNDSESYITRRVQVSNTGTGTLRIGSMEIQGTNAADYAILTSLTEIMPGATEFVEIQFAPKTAGNKSATFVVRSNASNQNVSSVNLRGTAGTRTQSTDTQVLFADETVVAGTEVSASVTVQNTGTLPIEIQSRLTNSADYAIVSGDNAIIPPGQSVEVTVVVTALTRGAKPGKLVIESNATNAPETEIELDATVGIRSFAIEQDLISVGTDRINGAYIEKEVCVEVTNDGDFPIEITDLEITGADAAEFILNAGSATSIPVGGSVNVCFVYRPTKSTASARLVITTNAPIQSEKEVILNGNVTSVRDIQPIAGFNVSAVYPNPAVHKATVRFTVESVQYVTVEVYRADGSLVAVPTQQQLFAAGTHELTLETATLASGTYFVKVSVPGGSAVGTLQVIK